jgi:hypothetical protein
MTRNQLLIALVIPAAFTAVVEFHSTPTHLDFRKLRETNSAMRRLQDAATAYVTANPDDCPTIDDLKSSDFLEDDAWTTDGWRTQLDIFCMGGRALVKSAGPDGELDTFDDIRLPIRFK